MNRQYAVEEFPEADVGSNDNNKFMDLQAHYGTGETTTKKGKKSGSGGKKTKKTKPSKAPKPSKSPKVKKTIAPKTSDPTTAAPVTPNPTTSWPTAKPTPRPTTGWPTAKPTAKPTPPPTNPAGMTCAAGAKGVLSTEGALDDVIVALFMDCDAQTL